MAGRLPRRRPARQIAYSPVGSGAGIAAITARQVDFGASDAPLSPDQLHACNGCVQIPWALSATSVIYNLAGVPNNLHMTGPVLARIYLGQITKWDDPAIKALNPKVNLPSTDDHAGLPQSTTRARPTTSPTTSPPSARPGRRRSGVGVNANWPAGQGGRGSSGVAGVVSNTQGAIGYVDVAFALKNQPRVHVDAEQRPASYTTPGPARDQRGRRDGEARAGDERDAHRQPAEGDRARLPDLHVHLRDPADRRSTKAADLRKFVFYAVNPTQGQKLGPKLLFAPLPKVVLVAAEKTLKKIPA